MRSRTTLYALLFVVGLFALPYAAHAASIPFFGPIIPETANRCAAGWGAVIEVINNIIRFLISLIVVFIAPLMLAYAGFMYVVNPVNPSNIQKAKDMMLNTVYGLIVALVGWMVVDAVMVVLYNPNINASKAWSDLITSGGYDFCLIQESLLKDLNQTDLSVRGISANGMVVNVGGTAGALCSDANTACSPSTILQAAEALKMTLSSAQAKTMSCIAVTESTGNPAGPNSSTGACGTFQITNKTSTSNWQNPVFHQGSCSTSSSCNDAQCNLQTALIMFNKQGYQPWTGKNPDGTYWNPNAVACVQRYSNG